MSIPEILAALFNSKGLTPTRVQKAQALATRSHLNWNEVVAAMSPEQRALLEGV